MDRINKRKPYGRHSYWRQNLSIWSLCSSFILEHIMIGTSWDARDQTDLSFPPQSRHSFWTCGSSSFSHRWSPAAGRIPVGRRPIGVEETESLRRFTRRTWVATNPRDASSSLQIACPADPVPWWSPTNECPRRSTSWNCTVSSALRPRRLTWPSHSPETSTW